MHCNELLHEREADAESASRAIRMVFDLSE